MPKAKPTKPPAVCIEVRYVEQDSDGPGVHLMTDGLRKEFTDHGEAEDFYELLKSVCCLSALPVELEINNEGHYCYDCGTNHTGTCDSMAKARALLRRFASTKPRGSSSLVCDVDAFIAETEDE